MTATVPLVLPSLTFLCGAPDTQKHRTEIAHYISDVIPACQPHSFMSPLRDSALGLLHHCDPSINIEEMLDLPIPISVDGNPSYREFMAFHLLHLQSMFGKDVLGQLTEKSIGENMDYFDCFVIDDGLPKFLDDIRYLIKIFSDDNCLIVNIYDDGKAPLDLLGVKTIHLTPQATAERTFESLRLAYEGTNPHD